MTTEAPTRTSVLFSIHDKVGGLSHYLDIIKKYSINMTRIESRPSKTPTWDYDFTLDFEVDKSNEAALDNMMKELQDTGVAVRKLTDSPHSAEVAWFPRKISDLDAFNNKTMEFGEELTADHPGFTDPVYRERRKEITKIASAYRHGDKIPKIDYTKEEIETWGKVFSSLKKLLSTNACRQHRYVFPLLEQNCSYNEHTIPQLQDVSDFLKDSTGFTLRPVMGLLSSRDFLNGLAFRVFHATQYIRHPSTPLYTPEPDLCHELLGHVPLFADPEFADFSQEIGLASLGASDEDIERLSTCYWFSIEFGVCKEGDSVKAYGAGLLSSFGELEHCVTDKSEHRPFDPFEACKQKYPITEYQPVYFVADSFATAQDKMKAFADSLSRPFSVRYNPYTQTVEILDNKDKIVHLANQIRNEASLLSHALTRLNFIQ